MTMTSFPNIIPMVSIIVTTYNHGPYIEECIESIVNQKTNFAFEILVGEDCSSDDTRTRVKRMVAKYPALIRPFLHAKNLGAHNNANLLYEAARGKYAAICEGDDYWHCDSKLQQQVDILESDPGVSLVCTDADALFQNTGRIVRAIHERNGQWNCHPEDMTLALLTRKINIFTCSACMPLTLLLKVQRENPYEFSSEQLMGDIQLWLELSRLGRVVPIRESMTTYRVLSNSASHSHDLQKRINFSLGAMKLFERYVAKFGYDEDTLRKVRMNQIWCMIYDTIASDDDSLRVQVEREIRKYNFQANNPSEFIAFWSIESQHRYKIFGLIFPIFSITQKISGKFCSIFRRISLKIQFFIHSNL